MSKMLVFVHFLCEKTSVSNFRKSAPPIKWTHTFEKQLSSLWTNRVCCMQRKLSASSSSSPIRLERIQWACQGMRRLLCKIQHHTKHAARLWLLQTWQQHRGDSHFGYASWKPFQQRNFLISSKDIFWQIQSHQSWFAVPWFKIQSRRFSVEFRHLRSWCHESYRKRN